MNILGFVLALLIIFSIIANSMMQKHKNSLDLKKSIEGFYSAHKMSENSFENFKFKSIKNHSPKAKTSSPQKKENSTLPKKKKNSPKKIYDCARLNILPLLKKGKEAEKEIYNILYKLIDKLYLKNPKNFLDSLIKASKNFKNENIILEKITFKDSSLQYLWYQMLKGSKFYNREKKLGYPSILEFVTLKNNKKICIHKAPEELIIALFGEEKGKKLIDIRKEKKEKIPDLIKNEKMLSLIDFSHKKHNKNALIICTDEKSKISIKKSF